MKKNKYILLIAIVCLTTMQLQAQNKAKSKTPAFKNPNRFCSTIQPERKSMPLDTTISRAMADNYYLWDNGKTLTVKFIGQGGSTKLREKIKVAAKEWEKYANLTFDLNREKQILEYC